MKKIVFFTVLFCTTLLSQNTATELFTQANENYKNKNYEQALTLYQAIVKKNNISAELYFNLGNTYYKLGKVAPAIYNYEKALLLKPNDKAITTNLYFAQQLAVDDIKNTPEVGFYKIIKNTVSSLHYNSWAWLVVLFSGLILLFFIGYYFSQKTAIKRFFFIGVGSNLFFFFISLFATFLAEKIDKEEQPAIVFSENVQVKSEPMNSAETVFDLHEGAKVFIKDEISNWYKIEITDTSEGWLHKGTVKRIK